MISSLFLYLITNASEVNHVSSCTIESSTVEKGCNLSPIHLNQLRVYIECNSRKSPKCQRKAQNPALALNLMSHDYALIPITGQENTLAGFFKKNKQDLISETAENIQRNYHKSRIINTAELKKIISDYNQLAKTNFQSAEAKSFLKKNQNTLKGLQRYKSSNLIQNIPEDFAIPNFKTSVNGKEYDVANLTNAELPDDLKAQNIQSAESIINEIEKFAKTPKTVGKITIHEFLNSIHNAWAKRLLPKVTNKLSTPEEFSKFYQDV